MLRICWLVLLGFSVSVVLGDGDELKDWWKHATIYQIYPRSFKDTNGDGIGDLSGIKSELEYLTYAGIGAAWLSPVYESPMKDFGYDITNHTKIDPLFGTMDDFDQLVAKIKQLGLKIIMDFVPNHTSNTSIWFQKSVKREDPYTDYYVWVDGTGENKDEVPNNWLGMFGGSAWEWVPERKQFYYHQFIASQPDLNFRNPRVRRELSGEYNSLRHIYTTSDPKVLDVMYEWRAVLDEFERKDGLRRVMMVEINETIPNTVAYYGNASHPLAEVPFNFEMFKISKQSSVQDIRGYIEGWVNGVPESDVPNWIIGNHDQPRIANRTDGRSIDAYNMINLLLPGLALTYYGEEIGMVDTFVTWEQTQDPFGLYYGPERYTKFSRDPQRTPMQWSHQALAGFTKGHHSWLPVNPNYKKINVQTEKSDHRSHLSTYRRLQAMRTSPAGRGGRVHFPLVADSVLCFTRTLETMHNHDGIVVVINFGDHDETVDLTRASGFAFPSEGRVGAFSDGIADDSSLVKDGGKVDLSRIKLAAKQAVALWFKPRPKKE